MYLPLNSSVSFFLSFSSFIIVNLLSIFFCQCLLNFVKPCAYSFLFSFFFLYLLLFLMGRGAFFSSYDLLFFRFFYCFFFCSFSLVFFLFTFLLRLPFMLLPGVFLFLFFYCCFFLCLFIVSCSFLRLSPLLSLFFNLSYKPTGCLNNIS